MIQLHKMLVSHLFQSVSITPVRHASIWKNYKKLEALAKWEGGKKYKGFTYYPKPGEVDPPYEPSRLFMVQRTGDLKGTEYWYKKILYDFKLDIRKGKPVIVKNTPDNNEKLWKVKHLVKITPITFPDGLPTEDDVLSTFLNHKGELEIKKKIGEASKVNEIVESKPNPIALKRADLKRQSLMVWTNAWKSPYDH